MDRVTITVFEDDKIQDVIDRMQFVLNEIGVRMVVAEAHDDSVVYSLSHAERLGDAQKG